MSDQSKVDKITGVSRPTALPDLAGNFQDQMKTLLANQRGFLEESQAAMKAWSKRSQDAVEDGLRTFRAACECKDPVALVALYADWLSNSMTRLFANIDESRDEAIRLAGVGQKSMTALFERSAEAAASARTSPFTVTKAEVVRTTEPLRSEALQNASTRTVAE